MRFHKAQTPIPQNNLSRIIGRDLQPITLLAIAASLVCALVGTWEVLARMGVLPAHSFPAPTAIAERIWLLETQGEYVVGIGTLYLHDHILASAWRVIPGLVAGTLIGYPVAIWLSVLPALRYFSTLVVAGCYGLSAPALYVILQAWFGVGELPKMVVSAWVGFGLQLIVVYWRCRTLLYNTETATTYWRGIFDHLQLIGVSRWRVVWEHLVPLLSPQMFLALMAAAVISVKMLVFTEMSGMARGIGFLVTLGRTRPDITLIFTGAVLLILFTLCLWGVIWLVRLLSLHFEKE